MIREDNIFQMLDKFLESDTLTTNDLKTCGFTSNDLSKMTSNGMLKRVQRGFYVLSDESIETEYFHYGKKLIMDNKLSYAYDAISKCYDVNPNNAQVNYELFYLSIALWKFDEKLFKYMDSLFDSGLMSPENLNMFISILNGIVVLPDYYKDYLKDINYEFNTKLNEKDERTSRLNEIRRLAWNQEYSEALFQLEDEFNSKMTRSELTLRNLLIEAVSTQNILHNSIKSFITNEAYTEAIVFLEAIKEKTGIRVKDEMLLDVLKTYLEVKNSRTFLVSDTYDAEDTYEAIGERNYRLALSLVNSTVIQSEPLDELFLSMLKKLCTLLDEITHEEHHFNKDYTRHNRIEEKKDYNREVTFEELYSELLQNQSLVTRDVNSKYDITNVIKGSRGHQDVDVLIMDKKNKIGIRYKKFERINIKEIESNINRLMKEENYSEAIELALYELRSLSTPRAEQYLRLGMLYLAVNSEIEALPYLVVADALSDKINLEHLINKIENKQKEVKKLNLI